MPDQEDMLIDALGLGNRGKGPIITTTEPPTTEAATISTLKPHLVQPQASLNRCPGGTGQTGRICTDAPYNSRELSITFIII